MYIVKKAYNFHRNLRSKLLIMINKMIYSDSFQYGKDFYVQKGFIITIEEHGKIKIGNNVFFNNFCSLNSLHDIEIGDNCIFGENVKIYDHNHIYAKKNIPVNNQGFTTGKVKIGENTWVASNVTILKGVTIGKNCVIGANSIISRDIPDDSIVTSTKCNNVRPIRRD